MRANTGSQVVSFLNLMSFSDSSNLASGGFLAASPLICNCLELREGHRGWSVAYRKWGTKKKKKASRPSRSRVLLRFSSKIKLAKEKTLMGLGFELERKL